MYEAVITGVVGIVVCMINNYFQNRKTVSLVEYRLKKLEEKVGKHNNLVERMYQVEEDIALNRKDIKTAYHRIDDLKELHK